MSYSPVLGRWMEQDPAGYVDGANLYEFAASSPDDNVDPLGLYKSGYQGGRPTSGPGSEADGQGNGNVPPGTYPRPGQPTSRPATGPAAAQPNIPLHKLLYTGGAVTVVANKDAAIVDLHVVEVDAKGGVIRDPNFAPAVNGNFKPIGVNGVKVSYAADAGFAACAQVVNYRVENKDGKAIGFGDTSGLFGDTGQCRFAIIGHCPGNGTIVFFDPKDKTDFVRIVRIKVTVNP